MSAVPKVAGLIPLSDIIAYHAAADPHRPALTQDGVTLTREELDRRSNRQARRLARHGVGQGDFVIVALPNSITFFETTFALWKLGAVPCPISPKMPPAECAAVVASVRPRLVVGPEVLRFDDCPTIAASPGAGEVKVGDGPLPSRVSPSWKAIASGGSTGRPKIIVTDTDGRADPVSGGYAFQQAGDTILNPGPLYHNAAFSAAHQCLFAGGHVVNMERFDAETSLQLIDRHRVAYVMMVPTMMRRIWGLPEQVRDRYDLSSLRTLVHLGGPCPAWLKQSWIEWIGADRIWEIYAGTEGIGATAIGGADWMAHRGSVGRPVGDTMMRILRPDLSECTPGETGEIYFRSAEDGATGFRYIGTDVNMVDGWSSLGDLGHVDEAGFLYISDRRTDLIVSGGVNVYPAEVEAAIDRYPGVRTSVVVGLPDDDLGNRVHAIVQIAPDRRLPIDHGALGAFLGTLLARYKIPRSFEFVTENLRDEAGKARRARFREDRIREASSKRA